MRIDVNMEKDFSKELVFNVSRSSGPGGQSVNKLNTKVELRFDVINSQILTQEEKDLVFDKLHKKISIEGILIVINQTERSQLKNKELAIARFNIMMEEALRPPKIRKKTKPSKKSKEKRLKNKQKHAEKKHLRKRPNLE